ncbi:MAG: tRNA pseudouridine(38-40) synthase TruA [Myxococcota bacterium]|nr:tRNA pseudouridine(38-40) synthase TruA [Myxococcota bacterium]
MAEVRWRLDAAWNGEAYCGWQRQPNGLSVQETIEQVCTQLFNEPIKVVAAGRTDAGVHVAHQVLGMTTPKPMTKHALKRGLNALLPNDISVLSVQEMPPHFQPRSWGYKKWYRYRWLFRDANCPFRRNYVWHVHRDVNTSAMHVAARHFEGTHEFSAFRASGCSASTTHRTIEQCVFQSLEDDEWVLDVYGNGFLRHQVRIMAGTLLGIGVGRFQPQDILRMLSEGQRTRAGQTAPAQGLTLMCSYVRAEEPLL